MFSWIMTIPVAGTIGGVMMGLVLNAPHFKGQMGRCHVKGGYIYGFAFRCLGHSLACLGISALEDGQ
jgi:hypothetical protein